MSDNLSRKDGAVMQHAPLFTEPSFLTRLLSRRVGGMLARNTVVSTGVFLVGLGVLWVLVNRLGADPVISAGVSFVVANSLHYIIGRKWIFPGTTRRLHTGYAIFIANSLVGLLVTMVLFAGLLHYTSIHYIVARTIVSVFAGLAVFVLNAALNFRQV